MSDMTLSRRLQLRARILNDIRAFFIERQIMEVETPILSSGANTDPSIESFSTRYAIDGREFYLHTSPEFAMKRLLVQGSGSIFQLAKVFRDEAISSRHNPEFTLLEWYRVGWDYQQLMQEVATLVESLLDIPRNTSITVTYVDAFLMFADIDIATAQEQELKQAAIALDIEGIDGLSLNKRQWLDLLMAYVIEPKLPVDRLVFITDYPADQASLAKLSADGLTAQRFELFYNGVELANGFTELTDAQQQLARFKQENIKRKAESETELPIDRNFIAALQQGMPECAGVAVGVDRLLMLQQNYDDIRKVLAFTIENA